MASSKRNRHIKDLLDSDESSSSSSSASSSSSSESSSDSDDESVRRNGKRSKEVSRKPRFVVEDDERWDPTYEQQVDALNRFLGLDVKTDKIWHEASLTREEEHDPQGKHPWRPIALPLGNRPPNDFTVTQLRHAYDLHRVSPAQVELAKSTETQSSDEWLRSHGLVAQGLTMQDLMNLGKVTLGEVNKLKGTVQKQLQFGAGVVDQFEYRLQSAIDACTKRIKWLFQGSRRAFGLLPGKNVGLIFDASDANLVVERLSNFQQMFLHLIDDQLQSKSTIYVTSFGTEASALWKTVMPVNHHTIEQLKMYAQSLHGQGSGNMLEALQLIGPRLKMLDTLVFVLGSLPDQDTEYLLAYIAQLVVAKPISLHCVSYDCSNYLTNQFLRNIADLYKRPGDEDSADKQNPSMQPPARNKEEKAIVESIRNKFHCYSTLSENEFYASTDVQKLLREIGFAQELLKQIEKLRQGVLDKTLSTVVAEISTEVSKVPVAHLLPRPPGHMDPLRVQRPKNKVAAVQTETSSEWLAKHGLSAKQLDIYQILAPNAHSFVKEFVPSIKKMVRSQVNERAMVQFKWKTGEVKNLHVDVPLLKQYQKRLGELVNIYEKRIKWLTIGSRRLWGTVAERSACILVDLSLANTKYVVHIQHAVRLVLEQQFWNKEYFNIIVFGSEAKAFSPTLVKVTDRELQRAWQWLLNQECLGSRNVLGAIKLALENEDNLKHGLQVGGLYLFTSGLPDQPIDILTSYVEELCIGGAACTDSSTKPVRLHATQFEIDPYDLSVLLPGRYATPMQVAEILRKLAHTTGGRFHRFTDQNIIESDDITLIAEEIEKMVQFSRECSSLIDLFRNKSQLERQRKEDLKRSVAEAVKAEIAEAEETEEPMVGSSKWLAARINSGERPPLLGKEREVFYNRLSQPRNPGGSAEAKVDAFYISNEKKDIGTVIKSAPSAKVGNKKIGTSEDLPEDLVESGLSSKSFMKKYSLKKLHLDLHRLIGETDWKHEEAPVKQLNGKRVEAKYCDNLPCLSVNGQLRHMHLLPNELRDYVKHLCIVLKRYARRVLWLLTGSRRSFGAVFEKKVAILVDVSGSMVDWLGELKSSLKELIWDQLFKNKIHFTFVKFSDNVEVWPKLRLDGARSQTADRAESRLSESLEYRAASSTKAKKKQDEVAVQRSADRFRAEVTEDFCHRAVEWVDRIEAFGGTNTLDAVKVALCSVNPRPDAIYVVSDGKPDQSADCVLQEIATLNKNFDRTVTDAKRLCSIHTIAYRCDDNPLAQDFLKQLCSRNGGRFHKLEERKYLDVSDFCLKVAQSIEDMPTADALPTPTVESDDIKRLLEEIDNGRRFLERAKYCLELYFQYRQPPSTTAKSASASAKTASARRT